MSLEYEDLTTKYSCLVCESEWYNYKGECPNCSSSDTELKREN